MARYGGYLLADDPVFATHLKRCDEALAPYTGWSVRDVLSSADGAPALEGSQVIQPVLFALMVALAEMWRAAGIEPAAVVGHSQGEIAAAYVSGALSLDDAAKVAALRSQVLSALDGTGGVLSVALPVDQVRERLTPWADKLWVAVDNGPSSTVIAGDPTAMDEFTAKWGDTVRLRRTALDYASHTPHMAAVRDELIDRIGTLKPTDAMTAICSSCEGGFVPGTTMTTEYWYRSLAGEVRFDAAVRAFHEYANPLFIEVSPHPILAGAVQEILESAHMAGGSVGSLRRGAGTGTSSSRPPPRRTSRRPHRVGRRPRAGTAPGRAADVRVRPAQVLAGRRRPRPARRGHGAPAARHRRRAGGRGRVPALRAALAHRRALARRPHRGRRRAAAGDRVRGTRPGGGGRVRRRTGRRTDPGGTAAAAGARHGGDPGHRRRRR